MIRWWVLLGRTVGGVSARVLVRVFIIFDHRRLRFTRPTLACCLPSTITQLYPPYGIHHRLSVFVFQPLGALLANKAILLSNYWTEINIADAG